MKIKTVISSITLKSGIKGSDSSKVSNSVTKRIRTTLEENIKNKKRIIELEEKIKELRNEIEK